MKIAIDVSQAIYGTGVSRYTRHLVRSLLDLNSPHKFLLFGGSIKRKKELHRWIDRLPEVEKKIHHLSPRIAHLLWNTLHLIPVETFIGPVDLIHTSDWAEPPSKAPKVTTIHDLSFFQDPSFVASSIHHTHKKRLFWVAKESAHIIAVSHSTKEDIIKHLSIPSEKITVIHEASTLEKSTRTEAESAGPILSRLGIDQPFLLVPGSGHPRKNVARIVQAFRRIKNLNYQLVISGLPTPDESFLASSDVIFTGQVSGVDLGFMFSQAQALIYPSLYEGFGLPILDSFAVGTPVLTSNISSLPEVAGNAAVLVNPESVEEISAGIIKVLKDRHSLTNKGFKQLKKFSWEKTARQTLKIYESVHQEFN